MGLANFAKTMLALNRQNRIIAENRAPATSPIRMCSTCGKAATPTAPDKAIVTECMIKAYFEAMWLLGEFQDTAKPLPLMDGQLNLIADAQAEEKPLPFLFLRRS